MAESEKPRVIAVIPARSASTRFPNKIIAPVLGHPLVYHTWRRASEATLVDRVIVAIDDASVADALAPYDMDLIMTRADHATGTDRIAEVMEHVDGDIVVNLQGDEPAIDPRVIDEAIRPLLADSTLAMSTARRKLTDEKAIADPNVVKVVCDQTGNALYFSRLPIPYFRDATQFDATQDYWQHIGLYVYRRNFLLNYGTLPQTPLERAEKLEQLRVLEHGYKIAVITTDYAAIGVDVPADLAQVIVLLQQQAAEG